jgi:hypothetical protein
MITTYQPGDTVVFHFPRYQGESATTASLKRYASTTIDTATVSESNTSARRREQYPVLMADKPNDTPVGGFVGKFDTTGYSAGTYYITLPTTGEAFEGVSGTYTKKAYFYLGAGL